jgi:hypothetical protein
LFLCEGNLKIVDKSYFEKWRLVSKYVKEGGTTFFDYEFKQDELTRQLSEMPDEWVDKMSGERLNKLHVNDFSVYDYVFIKEGQEFSKAINNITDSLNYKQLIPYFLDMYDKVDDIYVKKHIENKKTNRRFYEDELPNRYIDSRWFNRVGSSTIIENVNAQQERTVITKLKSRFQAVSDTLSGLGRGLTKIFNSEVKPTLVNGSKGGKSFLKKRTRKRGKRTIRRYSRKR